VTSAYDLDEVQLEFVYWLSLYSSIRETLHGAERQEALEVIDDDDAFDRWLEGFERKRELESTARASGGKPGKRPSNMSKDEFVAAYGCVCNPDKS
jgi:hypothetical protein